MLVVIGIWELYLDYSGSSSSSESGGGKGKYLTILGTFRTLRFLRIVNILKDWEKLNELVQIIVHTFYDLQYFVLLLLLYLFIAASLGKELFAFQARFVEDEFGQFTRVAQTNEEKLMGKSPRVNFDTFLGSFLTVFILLTGENWNEVMIDYARAYSQVYAYS